MVGPASVPVIDDVAAAERDPELAVLSCIAHGSEAHAEVLGRAALLATLRLSDERQVRYSDLVFAALSEAARAALEDLMAGGTYEFQSDFAKKHQAKGRAEGEAKGEAKGARRGDPRRLRSPEPPRFGRGPSSHPRMHRRRAACDVGPQGRLRLLRRRAVLGFVELVVLGRFGG